MSQHENLSEIQLTRVKLKTILRNIRYIEKPAVPELLFKPDFMISLENQLIFSEIASVTSNENVDWKTLRLIEHLFEIKLFYGNKSAFNLFILNKDRWKPYCIELLEHLFDKVTYSDELKSSSEIFTKPKTIHFKLWDLEREFEKIRYLPFTDNDLNKFQYQHIKEETIERTLSNLLIQRYGYLQENYPVRNLKNQYLGEARDLKFRFDFFSDNKIVEIKSFKKISDIILQNLLIKSRLIRYTKERGVIVRAPPDAYQMILIINGNLSGPPYDRFRYLRMLTNAGWDVYPFGYFITEQMENSSQ